MVNTNSQVGSINSVASGTYISCPKCGSNNKTDNKFCIVCGAEIINRKETETSAPAFGSVENAVTDKTRKYVEPNNAFAQGLPEWSLEPRENAHTMWASRKVSCMNSSIVGTNEYTALLR